MDKSRYYVYNIPKMLKMEKTLGELQEFLQKTFSEKWNILMMSTSNIVMKSRRIRQLKISITFEYAFNQLGKIEYRRIGLKDIHYEKPQNRKLTDNQIAYVKSVGNQIRQFLGAELSNE